MGTMPTVTARMAVIRPRGGGCAISKPLRSTDLAAKSSGAREAAAAERLPQSTDTPHAATTSAPAQPQTMSAPAQPRASSPSANRAIAAIGAAAAPPSSEAERYTQPASIWQALGTGRVRLVRSSWLVTWSKAGNALPRRQELPEEAFISVQELQQMVGSGNLDGVLPIIAISFCWLTPAQPDPEGKQLATVAATLEQEQPKYAKTGFSDMGVFWDWLSIYQMDPQLWRPFITGPAKKEEAEQSPEERVQTRAYRDSRTEEEQSDFRWALHQTMDLWYAHQGTVVYMLTKLPEGATRKVGYHDSGWTTYERCSAEQIKKFWLRVAWKLVLDLGVADSAKARSWPVGPDDFDELIKTREFTNGSDRDAVKALYRKMSIGQLGSVKELDFDGMSPPTMDDARRLGGCLNLCVRLKSLDVRGIGMSDEACTWMFSVLAKGGLTQLTVLSLRDNQIGDAGVKSLAEACASGALAQLEVLDLGGNRIGDAGVTALAQSCARGALPQLQELYLMYNQIGDAGVTALAEAFGRGALAQLKSLQLWDNQIGDAGVKALAEACASGAMSQLSTLNLGRNKIGDAGVEALAKACAGGAMAQLKDLSLNGNPASEAAQKAAKDAINLAIKNRQ